MQASDVNQTSVNILYDWCNLNRLSINKCKTKHMMVKHSGVMDDDISIPKIKVACASLENVTQYNYLGVLVDDSLNFQLFVDEKYKKVNFKVYQLKRIRQYISAEIACKIYKQTILPLLDYADFMIESGPLLRIKHLEKLQLKALKYIDNQMHAGQGDDILYSFYNIQPLALRWREHIGCIMYKLSHDDNLVDMYRPRINLRSNKKVKFKRERCVSMRYIYVVHFNEA